LPVGAERHDDDRRTNDPHSRDAGAIAAGGDGGAFVWWGHYREEPRERIWGRIVDEFERTERELLLVCDEERLLDRVPVLQGSIDRRNPYVDPISFVQVALLRRLRRGDGGDTTLRAILRTVNGIAGGLKNTG
jgi:phosphoenolpyruvate carboxylase